MNNSNYLLVSLGFGMLMLVFLNIPIPNTISLGIAVFVSIIALCDFYTIISQIELTGIKILDKIQTVVFGFFFLFKSILFPLSFPLAIFITFLIVKKSSLEEVNNFEQILTIYSLGILLMSIGFKKH